VVVRDITDIAHPKTVSTFSKPLPQFISATEVSYTEGNSLIRRRLDGSPTTVATSSQGIAAFAWNPDGSAVAYVAQTNTGSDVHQLTTNGDRVLGSIPPGGEGGCEDIASCQIPNLLDYRLSYSPDGTTISLVVNSFTLVVFRIWSSDAKLLTSNDSKGLTMSAWSGRSLYFRDANGVEVWRGGAVSSFLPGVAWVKPNESPGGGQIVYTARDSSGWGQIFVVDTATKSVRELKGARTDAVFLTSRFIWYQGERACVATDRCGPHPPFHPLSGKTYIYDLQDGTETESIITGVYDIWPHAA
jgi:Tol biopolymer transport system component